MGYLIIDYVIQCGSVAEWLGSELQILLMWVQIPSSTPTNKVLREFMSTFDQIVMYHKERTRLTKLAHARIKVAPQSIFVDVWCDGNDAESDQVIKITSKFRKASAALVPL